MHTLLIHAYFDYTNDLLCMPRIQLRHAINLPIFSSVNSLILVYMVYGGQIVELWLRNLVITGSSPVQGRFFFQALSVSV